MKPRNLLIAAILLAVLSGAVWWSKKHPDAGKQTDTSSPASTTAKMLDISEADLQSITLKKKDAPAVTLERRNGKWAMTAPAAYPTDQEAVNTVTSALSPVTADDVVEAKAADLSKYGLTAPALTVTAKTSKGKTTEIQFGDEIPVGSLVYAQLGTDPKVYAVSTSVKSSFDKTANDLRDKRLIAFDTNSLTRVAVKSAKSDLEFGKSNGTDWQIVKPQPYRADSFQVEELLRKLGEAKMDLGAGTDPKAQAETDKKAVAAYSSGTPVAIASLTDTAGIHTLEVKKNKDDYYARGAAANTAYKVSSDLGKALEKPLDEYRNKKVFDFGFSDPSKFELTGTLGERTYVHSGTDWKMNNQVMDPGSVQAFIDKVRDLAATQFATSGFVNPELGITVTSNEGKRVERVEFAKAGNGYLARRGSEPALYQLDAKAVNDLIEAAKAIKQTTTSAKK